MFHRLRIPLCHTNDSHPPQTMGTVLDQPYQVRVTVPVWRTPSASPRNSSAPISAIPLQSLTSPPPLDSRFGLCSGFSATHMATLQCSFCSIYAYKQRAKSSCAAMLLRSGTWQRSFCFPIQAVFQNFTARFTDAFPRRTSGNTNKTLLLSNQARINNRLHSCRENRENAR